MRKTMLIGGALLLIEGCTPLLEPRDCRHSFVSDSVAVSASTRIDSDSAVVTLTVSNLGGSLGEARMDGGCGFDVRVLRAYRVVGESRAESRGNCADLVVVYALTPGQTLNFRVASLSLARLRSTPIPAEHSFWVVFPKEDARSCRSLSAGQLWF